MQQVGAVLTEEDKEFDIIVTSMYDEYAKNCADKAHSVAHIKKVMHNVKTYYSRLDVTTRREFPEKFVLLVALYHDSGLLVPYHLTCQATIDEIRENHHKIGKDRFLKDYGKGRFAGLSYVTQKRIEYGALAILEHRASGEQTTQLSRFIRCCDGISEAEDILVRTFRYTSTNLKDATDTEIGNTCLKHLTEKYTGEKAYAKYPMDWAVDVMNATIKKLRSIVEKCTGAPTVFVNVVRNLSNEAAERGE